MTGQYAVKKKQFYVAKNNSLHVLDVVSDFFYFFFKYRAGLPFSSDLLPNLLPRDFGGDLGGDPEEINLNK